MGDEPTVLGRFILDFLAKTGMQQGELAEKIGVRESTVSRYVTGTITTPRLPVLKKLARVTGCPLSEITELAEPPPIQATPKVLDANLTDCRPLLRLFAHAMGLAEFVASIRPEDRSRVVDSIIANKVPGAEYLRASSSETTVPISESGKFPSPPSDRRRSASGEE